MEELEVPRSRTYNLTLAIYPEIKKKITTGKKEGRVELGRR